jgi:hypothetical protein
LRLISAPVDRPAPDSGCNVSLRGVQRDGSGVGGAGGTSFWWVVTADVWPLFVPPVAVHTQSWWAAPPTLAAAVGPSDRPTSLAGRKAGRQRCGWGGRHLLSVGCDRGCTFCPTVAVHTITPTSGTARSPRVYIEVIFITTHPPAQLLMIGEPFSDGGWVDRLLTPRPRPQAVFAAKGNLVGCPRKTRASCACLRALGHRYSFLCWGVNAINADFKSACGLRLPLDFDPVGLWAAETVSYSLCKLPVQPVLIELTAIYTLESLPKFVKLERGCWKY